MAAVAAAAAKARMAEEDACVQAHAVMTAEVAMNVSPKGGFQHFART
jgi:hypothetical protein